MTNSYQRWLY